MPIRFPRMHIAESVVNRILNVADELGVHGSGIRTPAPDVPDGADKLGAAIKRASTQPVPDLEPSADPIAGSVARGDDLVEGL